MAKTSSTAAKQTTETTKRPIRKRSVSSVPPASQERLVAHGPSHEEIARRAFELYLARGGEHGHHEEDWARAEQELATRAS